MKLIEAFFSSLQRAGVPGRGPFTAEELDAHRLQHPSDRQVEEVKAVAPAYLWPTAFVIIAFFICDFVGLLVITAARLVWYLCPLGSALLERRNFHRWNRPDVFLGWNYSAIANDETLPVSPFGARLIERMKPVWGAVVVIPMANIKSFPAFVQQMTGNRGVFLPCLEVAGPNWQPAVSWILGQVRAAVFEVSEGKASLDWELDEAIAGLGAERVLLVRQGPSGYHVATAAGEQLTRPAAIDKLPYKIERGSNEEAIATILGWCAENLYTPLSLVNRTRFWYYLYDREGLVLWVVRKLCLASAAIGILLIAYAVWQTISDKFF